MVRYETYRANAVEAPLMRRWILLGLVLSLALHAGLFYYLHQRQVEGFNLSIEQMKPAPVFHLKQVSIPEIPPDEQRLKLPEKMPAQAKLTLPSDKPVVEEIHVAPQVSELAKQAFNEKPKTDLSALDRLTKADANSRNAMDKELNTIAQSLIKDGPRAPRQPLLVSGAGRAGSGPGEGDANISIPGMASVDDLLSQTGALKAGAKAAMPGGALFEYDQYALLPESVEALRKLALLVQQNPKATFSIEGHSDSFGSPEYNIRLSEKRAESVKAWLVDTMGVQPARIQTRGFGNERPIVPADRSKEEQGPNRRVEIVVKTNRR